MSTRRSWWALSALALALLTIGLDATVLNVALPTMATDLDATLDQLQWFSTAYTLVLAAALMPAGMIGDRWGRKRLLVASLLVFGAASVWCAFAGSPGELIAARAVLGLAAAFMMPMSMGVLPSLFPEPAQRGKAVTVWVTATAVGLPLGPIVGGWLLEHYWWGSVFLINVPLVAISTLAVLALVPDSRSSRPQPLDLPGIVLSAIGLLGVTYGVIEAGQHGLGAAGALWPLIGGLLAMLALVLWERRASYPLVDRDLLRNSDFRTGLVIAVLVSFALMGLLFALPLYLQSVAGNSTFGTGLRLLPLMVGLIVGARMGELLVDKLGPRFAMAAGFVLMAGGLLVGTTTAAGTSFGFVAAWTTAIGVGLGLTLPTAMAIATGALTEDRAGAGSGLLQAIRQMAGTIGVAMLGAVLNSAYSAALPDTVNGPVRIAADDSVAAGVVVAQQAGQPAAVDAIREAFLHGLGVTLVVCAGIALAGLAFVLVVRPRPGASVGAESLHEQRVG